MSYRHFPGRVNIIPSLPSREVSYWYTCTKSGKLIIRKIVNIVTTRCHILKLRNTKSSPRPLAGYTGREWREGRTEGKKNEGGAREEGKGRKGKTEGRTIPAVYPHFES